MIVKGKCARDLTAVGTGGALGAGARFALTTLLTYQLLATILVNMLGCFLMGALLARLTFADYKARTPQRLWRLFLGVGFLGGFTTFSTFAMEISQLVQANQLLGAISYGLLMPVFAVTATWCGTCVFGKTRMIGKAR